MRIAAPEPSTLPLRIVTPLIDTFEFAAMLNTRVTSLPLIAKLLAPVPIIVMFDVIESSLSKVSVPDKSDLNVSVSLPGAALASTIALRRLPTPESFKFTIVNGINTVYCL